MQKRNLTKSKIIQATLELANDQQSIQSLTFQQLADKLSIKAPSLYNHFPNMHTLKKACTAELYRRLNGELESQLVGQNKAAAIQIYAEVYKNFSIRYAGSYSLLTNHQYLHDEELSDAAHLHLVIVRKILQSYHLKPAELIHTSRTLRSLVHGFISFYLLGYFQNPDLPEATDSFRFMIDQFISQLENK